MIELLDNTETKMIKQGVILMEEIGLTKLLATFVGAFLGTFAGTFIYNMIKNNKQRRDLH